MRRPFKVLGLSSLMMGFAITALWAQQTPEAERDVMYRRYLEFPSYVKSGSITPHWMADGSSFWYAEDAPENTVIYKIGPVENTKAPLFDTGRLRRALRQTLSHDPPYQGLPFSDFMFLDDEKAVQFVLENKEFVLQLASYALTQSPAVSDEEKNRLTPQDGEILSPDGRWFAGVKENNLWLRSTADSRSVQLTTDGITDYEWGDWPWETKQVEWSADSLKLAVKKRDIRRVPKIPLVHHLKPVEEVEWVPYTGKADAPAEQIELFIIDILSKRQVRIEIGGEPDQLIFMLGWHSDGSDLFFLRVDRYLRKLDVMAAHSATGSTRILFSETNEAPVDLYREQPFTLLKDGSGFIWLSRRSGWKHLYLYDMDGKLVRQLTDGAFPVVRVVGVDEKAGWVYFIAQGDKQRVYDTHLYRVNMDGKGFLQLTEAPGQHDLQSAPSKRFFLDTHSTTARPPTVELRRVDGTLLQTLSKADFGGRSELKWTPPEEFVVKAADGKADLYGILYKPYDFDSKKKYPVIEFIHGGMSMVPRTFIARGGREGQWVQAMAQLGFITFVVDGRGPWIEGARGREFEQVTYGSWGRYEIPDHVAALKQLAEDRAYMDLSRVGIMGWSMGGYYAVRALLQAPDIYRVGIAVAPVIEISEHLNYRWLGPPESNQEAYEYASNLRLAGNLNGKLLLIHGTNDESVPLSHTMKMVDALIRAGKPHDLMVLPEWGHWWNIETREKESYRLDAYRRYFEEHLKP
jgi:dipeptidyl aminopeptidase/acylaminoacyl peptidase